jgi:hypothetical protein
VVVGLISTVLYEKNGNTPGDGAVGYVLFGSMAAVIVFIWLSKAAKKHAIKEEISSTLSKEEIDLDMRYKKEVTEWEIKMKGELKVLHQKYEIEYAELERKFIMVDQKTDPSFLSADKELDEKYKKLAVIIGEKYSDLKNKLDVDLFNSVAKIHYKKNRKEGQDVELSPNDKANIAMAEFMNQTDAQKIEFDFNNGLLTRKEVQQIEEALKSGKETLSEAKSRILAAKFSNDVGLKNKQKPREYRDFDDQINDY